MFLFQCFFRVCCVTPYWEGGQFKENYTKEIFNRTDTTELLELPFFSFPWNSTFCHKVQYQMSELGDWVKGRNIFCVFFIGPASCLVAYVNFGLCSLYFLFFFYFISSISGGKPKHSPQSHNQVCMKAHFCFYITYVVVYHLLFGWW